VDHRFYYSIDYINTNTIVSFWALLKRGIMGQFHNVSEKFLPHYLAEFSYGYNNRKRNNLFAFTVNNTLNTNLQTN
jgi:hypothetical protein